ncbi:TPA_asm: coat protein [ssRNA phage Esthiorhiza.2_52]|uniref:Coat protein n=2 Tax=Fiersviridae TaxID=2842319 RepID=A0A8S5L3N6_9VIRU|nr:coat protein [ssRNA phage Esthiorhiza.2_52]QDH90310.1 MAG: hypothetical protein H2RhizoLitter8532_000002 [Leviviridae sp.]DAD51778.1 TPA_asm: coat protein [ssRNA phage Esthiorhiza.2_52]
MATNIVLADAQATPVNHTFIPVGRDKNGVYWFEDQSAANQIGNWRISVEFTRPPVPQAQQNSAGRTNRARIGLHEPVLETLSNSTVSGILPAPTVSYVPRSFSEFILPERATLQNRKDLRKMMASLLGETQMVALVESLTYIQ